VVFVHYSNPQLVRQSIVAVYDHAKQVSGYL
jgi:hypothetical protein